MRLWSYGVGLFHIDASIRSDWLGVCLSHYSCEIFVHETT